MYGCSAVGNSTMQGPTVRAPHLKAIFPMSPAPEYYDWGGVTAMFDTPPAPPAYPSAMPPSADNSAVAVDGDTNGTLLAAAKDQHRFNVSGPGYVPYRDSTAPWIQSLLGSSVQWWNETSIYPRFSDIEKSKVAIYQTVNMLGDDMRTKVGNVVKLNNLSNPMKSLFAPAGHCAFWNGRGTPTYPVTFDIVAEQHRFFDYWLKGIDNGIMSEPPIYYYMYNAAATAVDYRFAWQWPLPTETRVNYYLSGTTSDAVPSGVNNGTLSTQAPAARPATHDDSYTVDYASVSAKSGQGGDNSNATGMTYTTPALAADTKLIGSPIVHLWISSTANDGDFIANVWDVAPDGTATRIPGSFDGMLRASHRRLNKAPYDNDVNLPYHRSFAKDIEALTPGQPTELVFDEAPLAYTFKAGHRMRLVIICNGAKQDGDPFSNPPTPVLSPAPVVSFYHDAAHPSYITLPVNAPIAATARVLPLVNQVMAVVGFPKGMDRRYLKDIKANSVKLNGVLADNVQLVGDEIVATFKSGTLMVPLLHGEPMTIVGAFGNKYYYGEEMAFTDTVRFKL
jgi:putative CocE/NonD family hydrolase